MLRLFSLLLLLLLFILFFIFYYYILRVTQSIQFFVHLNENLRFDDAVMSVRQNLQTTELTGLK